MNFLHIISPYKSRNVWVFDDIAKGLEREPFVAGADTIIDMMVKDVPNAQKGFTLIFSDKPFPGHDTILVWNTEENGGNWYHNRDTGVMGWLCPALLKYFAEAPKEIYVQATK